MKNRPLVKRLLEGIFVGLGIGVGLVLMQAGLVVVINFLSAVL
jgi:hypothetical protein